MTLTRAHIPGLLFLLILLPWAAMQMNIRMAADAAWLFTAAEHLLAGQSMTASFFDNNPPLSYIAYIPAVLISWLGFSPWTAVNLYTFILIGVGIIFMHGFLSRWPGVSETFRTIILSAYAGIITIYCSIEFGQKDQLIAIMLPVFVLAQWFITEKFDAPKWLIRGALIVATPFIFLKPHFGLLAAALLLHRTIKKKRLPLDFDVACLVLGAIIYAAVIYFFFSDFVAEILPASLELYVGMIYAGVTKTALALLALCAMLFGAVYFLPANNERRGTILFIAMAALAAVVFWIQGKGFSLHIVPVLAFLFPALLLTLTLCLPRLKITPTMAVAGVLTFIALCAAPRYFPVVTHDDYRNSKLAQFIGLQAKNSYFIEAESTDIIYSLNMYIPQAYASRFPALWFLRGLEADATYADKFGTLVAEDLKEHKPDLVLTKQDSQMLHFFGNLPAFKTEWKNYRKTGEFVLDYEEMGYEDYPPMTYDIYKRR